MIAAAVCIGFAKRPFRDSTILTLIQEVRSVYSAEKRRKIALSGLDTGSPQSRIHRRHHRFLTPFL
jgi:hypothetical protein